MYKIYLIRDIHGLNYVGSTKKTLKERLKEHERAKRIGIYCSSHKLDFTCCKISILEDNITEENKKEKEQYWIDKIDCVNERNVIFDKENKKEYNKEYREKNKEEIKEYNKKYLEEHKEDKKEYDKKYRAYQYSWGGDKRYYNNLLDVNVDLFK